MKTATLVINSILCLNIALKTHILGAEPIDEIDFETASEPITNITKPTHGNAGRVYGYDLPNESNSKIKVTYSELTTEESGLKKWDEEDARYSALKSALNSSFQYCKKLSTHNFEGSGTELSGPYLLQYIVRNMKCKSGILEPYTCTAELYWKCTIYVTNE